MADFEAWLVFLILVVNVVGELQRKRTLAASRGFLVAARLSCFYVCLLCCKVEWMLFGIGLDNRCKLTVITGSIISLIFTRPK